VNWLKSNVYLASWLALPVAVLMGFLQAKKSNFTNISWFRMLMYFAFLTSLAVTFTPIFDQDSRTRAWYLVTMLLAVIIVSRHEN
jgi:hypothetical protein